MADEDDENQFINADLNTSTLQNDEQSQNFNNKEQDEQFSYKSDQELNNLNKQSGESNQSQEGEVISLSGHMPPISSPDIENTFDTFQPTDFSPDKSKSAHYNFTQHRQATKLDFIKNHEPMSLKETDIMFQNIQINQISNIQAIDNQELLEIQNIFKMSESQLVQVSERTGTQLVQPDLKIEKIEDQNLESSKTSRAEINCAVTKEIVQENQTDFKSIKIQKINHQRNKSENLIDANSKFYQNKNNFNDFSNLNNVQQSNNPYQDINNNQNLSFYLQLQEQLKQKRQVSSSMSRDQNLQEYISMSKKSPLNPISFKNINLQKSIDKGNIFDYVKYLEGNNSSIINKNNPVENSCKKACPFILQEMKESASSQTVNPSNSKCDYKIDRNEAIFNVKEFDQEDDRENQQEIETGEVRRLSTSSSGNIVSSEKKRFAIQDQVQQPFQGLKLQEFTIKLMNYNDSNINACDDEEGSENLVHDTQENCLKDKNSEVYNDTIINSNNNPIIKQIPFNFYKPCLYTQFQGNALKYNEQMNAHNDLLNKNQSLIASQTEVERFSSAKQISQSFLDQNNLILHKNSQLQNFNFQNNVPGEVQIVKIDIQGKQEYQNKSPQNQILNSVIFDNNQFYKSVTQDKLQNYFQLDFNQIKRFNELNQNQIINQEEKQKIQDLTIKQNQIIDNSKYLTFQGEGRSQNNIQQLKSLIENVHIDSLLQDCEKQDQFQNCQFQNLYYRTQPYNKKEQQNKIQFNSLIETKDLTKNRLTKSVCLQKYNNLITGVCDNKTENNFGKGYQRLISPVQNNANLSINFGQSMKLQNMNRGIPLGQDELVAFNNTDQKTQLNLMLDHQTNSIENLLHQNQLHGIGTCFKIDDSNKSSSNITSKNQLAQAINEQKIEHAQMDFNKATSTYIYSIPSPINGSENVNFGSQLNTQRHQNLPSNGTFLRTGIVDLNKSYTLNNFNQEDDCYSRNQAYSCYKSRDESKFNYINYQSLLNLTKNQQINTYNLVERAYRNDKIELQKQNALLLQRVDQQKQEIDELQQKGEKSKLQYEKIIQILRKNKKNKKRYQSKNSDHHSLILEENNNLQIKSESSSDNKSISNISQLSLKLLEMQHKEVEKIRELYEYDKKQKIDGDNIQKIQILNDQIENLKNSHSRDFQIQELKQRQEIAEKNQQIMNIQQQYQLQKIEYEKLIQKQNVASPSDNGEINETVNNFSNPTFKNNRINSIKQESEYIFQLEQQIQDLRNEIKKQVVDQQHLNIFNNPNNYQSNKSKSTQQQSRNIVIETKLSLLNKFHQKNIQEDLKSSVLLTRGTANDVQNFANSGSSREFLGLISKDYDEKQNFKNLLNDQCENLETTLECNAQKANNFIVQDENEISKKNYISSFLMGGETVEERYSATQSQNQKTFSKSLVSVNHPDTNQVEGSNDNLEKTASDSDEEKQKDFKDQILNQEINRLQSELLQAYQKEKVFLENFQKMNRKQNQLQQYNSMLLQKNQKNMVEITNLNFKLEQIMNILGNKQNGEQYYQVNNYQNENQLNRSLTKRQLSNTKKLSFSQIDCQDIYQTQEFLTQNFEEDNPKYQNMMQQNDETKQENKDDIQQNSQMQTIEEEDILQEDSRGNGIHSSKVKNESQYPKSSYVQQFEINQISQIPSGINSICKDVQLGSYNEDSPIIMQQQQHLNKWDSINQKSQEFKMQEKRNSQRITNNLNKSFKCVPVVQLKLEDFSNSQKQFQMSAPIGKKQYFMQSHKKALFSGQQASQSCNERKSQSSNDFNHLRSQQQTVNFKKFKNGNISSRSQDAPYMKNMFQNGMQNYILKKNMDDNTNSIADEKEGDYSSDYQNINNNHNFLQNIQNGNFRKSNVSFSQTTPKNYVQNFQNKEKNFHERQTLINSSFLNKTMNNQKYNDVQEINLQLSDKKFNFKLMNKYNTQNLQSQNILSLPNIIANLPQQELELLCDLLQINYQNIVETNIDEICRNLTEYMERIQYQDELENLKSKLPVLMKHMHMLRQQEIIKQHKLHQIDSSQRYLSIQPSSFNHFNPDYQDSNYLLNFQQNLKVHKPESRSIGINKLPLSNQNYNSQRNYTAYQDNQIPNNQQQKYSDTSKQSQIAVELESDKAHLNQNSNSQIKNVSTRFGHLQENLNFKQLNFSFQEKQANRFNEMQMEEILQENIFENEFIQNEQKSVFEPLENLDNFENNTFQNLNNQNLRKQIQVRNFNERNPQQKMNEIEECTFEGKIGTNLTNIHESKDQKQIVNKNKIVNHFYNNVQMMDIVPQTYRNTNYYSQTGQYDQNIFHPTKKNATPVFNGNQRWHSNSLKRRNSQLFFHSEKQCQNEKHSQVCNKSSLLRKQYNSVGSQFQLKNNREHYSQRAKGSVLCLLTGKYQQRASELNNQIKNKSLFMKSQKQVNQMFPKNLHDRLNINGANSFQHQNRSSMSLKDSVKLNNDFNSQRSLV